MKKAKLIVVLILVLALQIIIPSWAQSPQKMSYQAVIRNSSDKLITNHVVGMQISILQGTESGTVVYTETQAPSTNANGLVSIEIGTGTTGDDFSAINWAEGPYYISTNTDPAGGTNYTITGVSQLLSVPYALYAKNVENDNVDDADADPANEIQTISKTGSTVTLSNGGGSFSDAVNDADADPTNEIQVISISGNSLSLSGEGGTVSLPTGADNWGTQVVATDVTIGGDGTVSSPLSIAQQGATSGQVLNWNGSGWAPATISTGLTLPFINSGSFSTTAFSIENKGSAQYAIAGYSDEHFGVYGRTKSQNSSGVYGVGSGSNFSIGVVGMTGEISSTGILGNTGVGGFADAHIGVSGTAISGTGGYFRSSTGIALLTSGKLKLTGLGETEGAVLTCDEAGFATWKAPGWIKNGYDVYYNSGKVGIGITPGNTMFSELNLNGFSGPSDIHMITTESGDSNFDGLKVGYGGYGYIWNYENTDLIFGTNEMTRLTIKDNGNIGIGTSFPNYKLDIAGNLNLNRGISSGPALFVNNDEAIWYNDTYFSWGYGGTWNFFGDKVYIGSVAVDPGANMLVVNGAAAKPGGGSWSTWSDARLKDIHGKYDKGLNEIISLQPVKYSYKEGNACNLPSDVNYVGFVAQEVQKYFPEAVSQGNDGYLTVDDNSINVALVNAIKELKAENDRLRAENEIIDKRLTSLEKIIEASTMK